MFQSQNAAVNADDQDVLKLMIATDNHLGYNEKDAVRGEDSFIAFEEILEIAMKQDVDLVLLGGDLFHDAAPSQNALNKCIKLLKRVVLGNKPISVEFLSDQSINFIASLNQTVNYEDPNLNIALPIFSIHGNHDDPSGFGRLSSLDVLSSTGLINYFGRWVDLTQVIISPILLKKGVTQMALYGLSHIHDARLARLFRESKVVMETPAESNGEWFNLMVLHQNRAPNRGPTNYLPEDILPTFLDLVIWGHEHDCRILPEENCSRQFFVSQPGSSVATSLSEGESLPKHCGILQIYKKDFKMTVEKLQTVRPFVFKSIELAEYLEEYKLDEGNAIEKVTELAKEIIAEMIERANDQITDDPRQPKLPLIRLRIIYSDENQMFNTIRFGQKYSSLVANPQDMVHFKKEIKRINQSGLKPIDKDAINEIFENANINSESRVEDVVDRYFDEVEESQNLQIISSKLLSEMCFRLVERNDTNAGENIINFFKEKGNEYLMEKLPHEDNLNFEILNLKNKITNDYDNILKMLDARGTKSRGHFSENDLDNVGDSYSNSNKHIPSISSQKSKNTNERLKGVSRGRGRVRGGKSTKVSALDISIQPARQRNIASSFENTSLRHRNMNSSRTTKEVITYDISDSD